MHADPFTHRSFYTQKLLHAAAFTHRRFYTQRLLHTDGFTHRRFYTQTHLHTDAFTQTPLHTETFTHRRFYTQTILHTDAFTHRHFYTQTLLHANSFTHKHFDTLGLRLDKRNRNFTSWRSNLISCKRARGTRGTTWNRSFTSVFGDRTSFRTKGLRDNLEIAILPQLLAIEPHFVRKCLGTKGTIWNRNFTSASSDRTSFRAKGLRWDKRNRNFTSAFGDRTSFRAKRLRGTTCKSQFYPRFWRSNLISCERVCGTTWKSQFYFSFCGDRTSFRAKRLAGQEGRLEIAGLRFVPSRWHCPAPSREKEKRRRGQEGKRTRGEEDVRMWRWADDIMIVFSRCVCACFCLITYLVEERNHTNDLTHAACNDIPASVTFCTKARMRSFAASKWRVPQAKSQWTTTSIMSHEKRIANAAGCSHSLTAFNTDSAYAYVKQPVCDRCSTLGQLWLC